MSEIELTAEEIAAREATTQKIVDQMNAQMGEQIDRRGTDSFFFPKEGSDGMEAWELGRTDTIRVPTEED